MLHQRETSPALRSEIKYFHGKKIQVLSYSCADFCGGLCTLLTTGQESPTIVSVFLYVLQSNFLHYRGLGPKSLVTKKKEGKSVILRLESILHVLVLNACLLKVGILL